MSIYMINEQQYFIVNYKYNDNGEKSEAESPCGVKIDWYNGEEKVLNVPGEIKETNLIFTINMKNYTLCCENKSSSYTDIATGKVWMLQSIGVKLVHISSILKRFCRDNEEKNIFIQKMIFLYGDEYKKWTESENSNRWKKVNF
jgi:hypothetical protein